MMQSGVVAVAAAAPSMIVWLRLQWFGSTRLLNSINKK